jgi:copper chaperone NosL
MHRRTPQMAPALSRISITAARAMHRRAFLLTSVILLTSCEDEDRDAPPPRPLALDAVGQFCGMTLGEHPGPKGQIFIRDRADPYWFATVRETVAFTLLPEMPKTILAIYVSDLARSTNPDQPEAWVVAKSAWFVIGSRRRSGMDTPEALPFSDETAGRRFATDHGGRVVRLNTIPQSYIFDNGAS